MSKRGAIMEPKLTIFERKNLEEFIKSTDKQITFNPFIFSSIISLAGLILIIAAVVITLNNFNDRTAYWILLPGMIGGIISILFGTFLFRYAKRFEQIKKIAEIVKKMMTLV